MKNHIIKSALVAAVIAVYGVAFGQDTTGNISIRAMVADESIPATATKNIETKLQRALTINGIGDMDYTDRFVLTAKANVVSNDVIPSNPPRVSKKMDITLFVGDVIENKIYESCTFTVSGIGANDDKALVSAFSGINPQDAELQAMLERAKSKIMSYYTANCNNIITNANSLAGQQKYDEAIARLMSVPEVCTDCYEQCQALAVKLYEQRRNAEYSSLLNKAKNEWMYSKDVATAASVARTLGQIAPSWAGYDEVVKLREEIDAKLSADAQREWEFKMKQYDDEYALKKSKVDTQRQLIDACREIGVAWGKNQPTTTTKEIIRTW